MKKTILILLLLKTFISIAQSKKQQIETLTFRIDSLNTVIFVDRKVSSQNILILNSKKSALEKQIDSLNIIIKNINDSFLKKEIECKSLYVKIGKINNDLALIGTRLDSIKNDENIKTAAESQMPVASNKVTCTDKETKNVEGGDPILTKTCLYKKYKTISTGYPDYKGRYSYECSVFKKQENGNYVQIKNATVFNENKNELLSIINSKIEKDYKSYSNDPETKDCFEGTSYKSFNFDQLVIDFDVDKINFNVTFGLSGACMSVDGTMVSFSLDKIQKYLNE